MASQPPAQNERYTLEKYLELEDNLGYRSEFHDGVILPVEAATPTHAQLEAAVLPLLRTVFFPRCKIFGPSLNLYIPRENRTLHPDAAVVCGKENFNKPNCLDNPTVLVEITSPTTRDYDYGTKREYYFSLPSLEHYLLISQTDALVGHFAKSGDGWIYVDRGANQSISFSGQFEIQVSEIYAGILL